MAGPQPPSPRAAPRPAQPVAPRPAAPTPAPAKTRIPVPTPAPPATRRVPATPAAPVPWQGPSDAQLAAFIDKALKADQAPQAVADGLVARGLSRERSEAAVVAGVRRVLAGKVRRRGLVEVWIGGGLLLLGAGITGYTYLQAEVGDTFVVTTGLFFVGLLTIARGAWKATVTARKVRTA